VPLRSHARTPPCSLGPPWPRFHDTHQSLHGRTTALTGCHAWQNARRSCHHTHRVAGASVTAPQRSPAATLCQSWRVQRADGSGVGGAVEERAKTTAEFFVIFFYFTWGPQLFWGRGKLFWRTWLSLSSRIRLLTADALMLTS